MTKNEYRTAYDCITTLIDVVSKNGMLLLNVGQKADGTLTKEETQVLSDIGAWLRINGEGIYETVPYKFHREGDHTAASGMFSEGEVDYDEHDFRFTYKDGVLYAFQMKPSGVIRIRSLHTDRCGVCVEKVEVLGTNEIARAAINADGLSVTLAHAPQSPLPQCLKITLA